jgi:hypothetical protein
VKLCALHRRLDNAMESVEDAFRQSTLADVLADPNPSVPLCGGDPAGVESADES